VLRYEEGVCAFHFECYLCMVFLRHTECLKEDRGVKCCYQKRLSVARLLVTDLRTVLKD
jgi:hypothetical protein